MTKQELEASEAWKQLGPTAPIRYYGLEICNASRERYDPKNPDREAVILRGSPLGLCIDFEDRRGLECNAAYAHAPKDSPIVCRKDGHDYYPKTVVAKDGCLVLM